MMTTITVLKADGAREETHRDLPEILEFKIVRGLVLPHLDGGDLERVRVFHDGAYTDMFVDDESIGKGLPVNEAATAIYRCNVLTHDKRAKAEDLPKIYGPAVLFSREVWF
jgi:hypothetical protein